MNKILIALLLSVAATSTIACQCPPPKKEVKKSEPELCKTHEEFNIEEAKQKEQERLDRMRQRREALKGLINIP